MAKAPRTPNSKASRQPLQPLDAHLAALLNPALDKSAGFAEPPQQGLDGLPTLPPEMLALNRDDMIEEQLASSAGVAATSAALEQLLKDGNPFIDRMRDWTPQRATRPDKSEGGIRFRFA